MTSQIVINDEIIYLDTLEAQIELFKLRIEDLICNSYENVIRARILNELKYHLLNLKQARKNEKNPRFQKG